MSETVKTVLIVGGVAVGVVVLFKALSPSPALALAPKKPSQSTDAISLNSVIGLGTAIAGIFGGDTYTNEGTYKPNAESFVIQGNQLINPATGGAVIYGTD
jgi:hypothetical protein